MHSLADHPTVAIIVPCLNEASFIGRFLKQVLEMDYAPDLLSIWIVDGLSDDGTREILAERALREPRLRILDNPRQTTACALNLALLASSAEVVIRLDVHTDYPPNYVSHLVGLLKRHGVDNAGAVRLTARGETVRENVFSSLISSPFSNGGAPWRSNPKVPCFVETVYCGCFPKTVFDRVGVFDESMIRIEDREFNARIRAAGGRILLDPSLTCTYHPRTQLGHYLRWTFSGSFRLFYSRRLTRTPLVRPRNFVPMFFVLYHLALAPAAVFLGWKAFIPLILYALLALLAAVNEARLHHRAAVAFALPPLFYLTHLVYGIGGIWGIARSLIPLAPPRQEGKFAH